jgi:hypothetical protein
MRKILTYPFVFVLAALVFYIGAGVNVVSYCCDNCKSIGIDAVLVNNCCSHNETNSESRDHSKHACNHDSDCDDLTSHSDNHSDKYSDNHSDKKCCILERVSFDWDLHHDAKPVANLSTLVLDLVSDCSDDFLFLRFPVISMVGVLPNAPPLFSARDYLAFISVLLI